MSDSLTVFGVDYTGVTGNDYASSSGSTAHGCQLRRRLLR